MPLLNTCAHLSLSYRTQARGSDKGSGTCRKRCSANNADLQFIRSSGTSAWPATAVRLQASVTQDILLEVPGRLV